MIFGVSQQQKTVVSVIVSTGLYKAQTGFRELHMDNWYSAPELLVMLKTKLKRLAFGIVCINKKGWDQKVTNLSKSATRGDLKCFTTQSTGLCLDNGKTTRWSCSYQLYHWWVLVHQHDSVGVKESHLHIQMHSRGMIITWDTTILLILIKKICVIHTEKLFQEMV